MDNESIKKAFREETGTDYRPVRSSESGLTVGDFVKIFLVVAAIVAILYFFL